VVTLTLAACALCWRCDGPTCSRRGGVGACHAWQVVALAVRALAGETVTRVDSCGLF
jgi:hypothetical protein